MELFLIFLIIAIVMGIIAGIRRLVYKAKRKEWKDARPMEHPLISGSTKKIGKEGNLRWKAEKPGDSWNLIITNKKEFRWPAYILYEIPTWEDLIEARDKIIEKIQNLEEGKKWENIEPPENIMENKSTKLNGYGKGNIIWEIWKSSGVWKINISKLGFLESKLVHSGKANSWPEIIQLRDKLLEEIE